MALTEWGQGNIFSGVKIMLFQISNVNKIYKTPAGDFHALHDINLTIERGEFLGIVGKSGAGKTTLINMITGISEISSGEVLWHGAQNGRVPDGQPLAIHKLNENELALWRGENVGIVYQSFELLPNLDLVDNIMIPQDFTGAYRPNISRERAQELLDLVEIGEHANKIPAHISGGQKQRVAIARALVNDPPVIVADEPTGNLDSVTAETIFQLFERLVAQGTSVIMVTHDQSLAARFSRLLTISDGRLASVALRTAPGSAGGANGESADESPLHENGHGVAAAEGGDDPDFAGPTARVAEEGDGADTDGVNAPLAEDGDDPGFDGHSARVAVVESSAPVRGTAGPPAIYLEDVVKTYVNAAGSFTALRGIDLTLEFGQFISLVGKSGSGKSTLLNMISGIDHPTSGEVLIGGERIYDLSESKRALWRGKQLGIVFQFFQLLPTLTLLENTMLPMDYTRTFVERERAERAMELLRLVGLHDLAHSLPAAVSSGQQQSAAIARAMATDPPIIVADEPTGNLDSRSAGIIVNLFEKLAAQGKTILIVTHDPSLTRRTDQTIIISDGELIDKTVARILPLLDHPLMLEATRRATRKEFEPCSIIISQESEITHFYMVESGHVDIIVQRPGSQEMILARLGPGQYFGEVELLHGGNAIATARAAQDSAVRLAMLPREQFQEILDASPPTAAQFEQVTQERLAENRAKRNNP
ncbi:MAG: ATP-binding cassette domain-containing protein [Candidatus Promineifilaceae bacterium]|nr:ATP-binding cassette domain-containing protein [Candidatus Promineifilaceae bacterium]